MTGSLRDPVFSGTFYPHNPSDLLHQITTFSKISKDQPLDIISTIRACICPHAGYTYCGQTMAHSLSHIQYDQFDTVLIMGPSHRYGFDGVSVNTVSAYRTPLGDMPVQTSIVESLLTHSFINFHELAHQQEHSIEVILPFIQSKAHSDLTLIPMIVGQLDISQIQDLVRMILSTCQMDRTLVVASSDFSHFFSYDEACRMDQEAIRCIEDWQLDDLYHKGRNREIEMCGLYPILMTSYLMKQLNYSRIKPLHYCNSGDVTHDKDSVVGYASMIYY